MALARKPGSFTLCGEPTCGPLCFSRLIPAASDWPTVADQQLSAFDAVATFLPPFAVAVFAFAVLFALIATGASALCAGR